MWPRMHGRSPEESDPQRQEVDGGARGWGRGGERVFHGDRVSVWDDEKVLEMDARDDCTTE